MPVLPEVGSISVSPGLISPRASAWRIIEIAGRSFTEPAGLLPSSFTSRTFLSESGKRCSRTSGVLPMKSSMVRFIERPLAALQLVDVRGHAVLDGLELAAIARRAQPRQVRLGKALVALLEALGERDVLDEAALRELACGVLGALHRVDRRRGELVEGLRAAGAAVEDARHLAVLEEPEVHVDHVVDVHEVAALLAVAVPRRALEEPDLAGGGELVVGVERDRGHAALVRLVRPVDIEVAKAGDLRGLPRQRAAHQLVEQELGVALDVERALAGALLAELGARAVDRRRRGVQE